MLYFKVNQAIQVRAWKKVFYGKYNWRNRIVTMKLGFICAASWSKSNINANRYIITDVIEVMDT